MTASCKKPTASEKSQKSLAFPWPIAWGLSFALATILVVTGFIVANRKYSFFILPPDPISDRWGMAQILTVQA